MWNAQVKDTATIHIGLAYRIKHPKVTDIKKRLTDYFCKPFLLKANFPTHYKDQ